MPVNDALGKRMKEYYETIPKLKLMRKCPVILRIDGRHFHSVTRGLKRPFDEILAETMKDTMRYLCENIQGCVLGYTQSDEISLLLIDYQNIDTSAWFDYEVQKLCSISAGMATLAFNKAFEKRAEEYIDSVIALQDTDILEEKNYIITLRKIINKGAMFDSRCFNIPKEEVTNYFYWRQIDATRNSIQMLGQANFSHKELQNKSSSNIQDMLMLEKGINWNNCPTWQKRGSCCIKVEYGYDTINEGFPNVAFRKKWTIDNEIPIFRNEGRDYIEELVNI